MAKKITLTPEIIIATLKRSNLKTVLIEGKDDLIIYNKIENQLDDLDINIMPCNGRTALLEVYKSKDEIDSDLLFICDSDLWIYDSTTVVKHDLITTKGYSIENEIYQDGFKILDDLLTDEEIESKKKIISNICEWFAYEVEKYLKGQTADCKFAEVSILSTDVMKRNSTKFTEEFIEKRKIEKAELELENLVKEKYSIHLRGKYIFQVYEKIFQERSSSSITYRRNQLFDLVFNLVTKGDDTNKILIKRKEEISAFFN
jgi:hypothetical protein